MAKMNSRIKKRLQLVLLIALSVMVTLAFSVPAFAADIESGSETTHSITFDSGLQKDPNGSIEIQVGNKSYKTTDSINVSAGDTVTVKYEPKENYDLSTFHVNGKTMDVAQTIWDKEKKTRTFTMPDQDVTIYGVFNIIQKDDDAILNINESRYIKSVKANGKELSPRNYQETSIYYVGKGASVEVATTQRISSSKTGFYKSAKISGKYTDGTDIETEEAKLTAEDKENDSYTLSFTMPEGEYNYVTFALNNVPVKTKYDISVTPADLASHVGKDTDNVISMKDEGVDSTEYKELTIDNVIDGKYYTADITLGG